MAPKGETTQTGLTGQDDVEQADELLIEEVSIDGMCGVYWSGTDPSMAFDVDRAYEKHPQVAIRPEGFGGLAYHYGNRRLTFLKAASLVRLVEALADYPTAREAMAAYVPADRRAAYETALSGLLSSEVIRAR